MCSTRYYRVVLIFGLLIFFGCVNQSHYKISEEEPPYKNPTTTEARPFEDEKPSISQGLSHTPHFDDVNEIQPNTRLDKSVSSTEPIESFQQTSKKANQESIDSALDLCQAANDFWERGDLDQALDALDKAYNFILEVEIDNDLELSQ